jgi:hypothetical protein
VLNIPVLRWGNPYQSLEVDDVLHFRTGEPIAKVSQANGGIIQRDMKKAQQARNLLREIPIADLIDRVKQAADLYENATLPMGDGSQSPDDFVLQQSASTGLPEHMCRANMKKNSFVLENMDQILDCLTRGLDLSILSRGWGMENRGVVVSYQAQSPDARRRAPLELARRPYPMAPGHSLQLGLVLKPGPQEPWTPYRMVSAFIEAGVPKEVFALYPGGPDAGAAVLNSCDRAMIFGGTATVEQYKGNPRVQAHGPGFSKILLGDDVVDRWEDYIDIIAESIYINSGRGCINCSGVWASRHTKEIAAALAERLGPIEAKPPEDPEAGLAAFTVPGMAKAVWGMIEADLKENGVTDMTSPFRIATGRDGTMCIYPADDRALFEQSEPQIALKEFMFPFSTVVECPQDQMLPRSVRRWFARELRRTRTSFVIFPMPPISIA